MFKSRLLSIDFNTERLTTVGETNKTDYQAHLTSQAGMLQPYGDMEDLGGGFKVGQVFKLFSNRIDINVSDKVTVSSVDYIVKSIKDITYGTFPHKEIIVVKL